MIQCLNFKESDKKQGYGAIKSHFCLHLSKEEEMDIKRSWEMRGAVKHFDSIQTLEGNTKTFKKHQCPKYHGLWRVGRSGEVL